MVPLPPLTKSNHTLKLSLLLLSVTTMILSASTMYLLYNFEISPLPNFISNHRNDRQGSDHTPCSANLGRKHHFQTVILLSYPGCGNTWTRHLIEQATGYLTGSAYKDSKLRKTLRGELEDPHDQTTIVVKAHQAQRLANHLPANITVAGCVLIMRDPKNAILSNFALKVSHSHTEPVTDKDLRSKNWTDYSRRYGGFRGWAGTYREEVLHNYCQGKITIIWYEAIKSSTQTLIDNLSRTVDFLNEVNHFKPGQDDFVKFRSNCLKKNLEGSYHRKYHQRPDMEKYFTPAEKLEANQYISELEQTLLSNLGNGSKLPPSYYFAIDRLTTGNVTTQ